MATEILTATTVLPSSDAKRLPVVQVAEAPEAHSVAVVPEEKSESASPDVTISKVEERPVPTSIDYSQEHVSFHLTIEIGGTPSDTSQ